VESPEEIIARKRREIEANGWTLWSFKPRTRSYLNDWYRELSTAGVNSVFVFCSKGKGAVDPDPNGKKVIQCQSYRFIGEKDTEWLPMPNGVSVPHMPVSREKPASAFVVQRIKYPVETFPSTPVEWFSREKGPWRQEMLTPRTEYLIRPGGHSQMPGFRAILELKPPYLAVVA
jgi:hypothetical protein